MSVQKLALIIATYLATSILSESLDPGEVRSGSGRRNTEEDEAGSDWIGNHPEKWDRIGKIRLIWRTKCFCLRIHRKLLQVIIWVTGSHKNHTLFGFTLGAA